MCEKVKPDFETTNFEVFLVLRGRHTVGNWYGDTYLAFYRYQDVSQPVCHVTLSEPEPEGYRYVLWIEVNSENRREGIATEVLLGLQQHVGPLFASGTTDAGKAFVATVGTNST